jgi:hypothetical protein
MRRGLRRSVSGLLVFQFSVLAAGIPSILSMPRAD